MGSEYLKIRVCRICLEKRNENDLPLDFDSMWSSLFDYCLGLTVTEKINAPKVICEKCAMKLEAFAKFKKVCYDSQQFWKSLSHAEVTILTEKRVKTSDSIKEEPIEEDDLFDYTNDENFCMNDLIIDEKSDETKENSFEIGTVEIIKQETTVEDEIEDENSDKFKEITFDKIDTGEIIKEETVIEDEPEVNVENKLKENKASSRNKKKVEYNYTKANFLEKYGECVELQDKNLVMWQCKRCHKQYKLKGALLNHICRCRKLVKVKKVKVKINANNYDSTPNSFYCGICDFTSLDNSSLNAHLLQHISNNDLDCKLCEYVGRDFADMITHRLQHQKHEITKKTCVYCDKTCFAPMSLQFHFRSKHLNRKGGWCQYCGYQTSMMKVFKTHVRCHTEPHFMCDHCGSKFLSRRAIIAHMAEHTVNYTCETCGKGFKRLRSMAMHIKFVHNLSEQIRCSYCPKILKNQYTLRCHFLKMHREKPIVCPICLSRFPTPNFLKAHMVKHTDEKPFTCEICKTKYKRKSYLKVHMRIHSGSRPFLCTICEKGFISSSVLKRHQSVHTGVRQYKCPQCEKSFHHKRLMLEHCKLRHDDLEERVGETQTTSA